MQPADQERVKQISTKYRWRDVAGQPADFLSANELENLTIRAGTLTAASARSSTITSRSRSRCSRPYRGRST